MRIRTRILARAKERGMTAAEIARKLKLYRSNLSAMDAGRRSPSLRLLARIAALLDCSPADLIEIASGSEISLFSRKKILQRLDEREASIPDGIERGWVHAALLAWQRHYNRPRGGS